MDASTSQLVLDSFMKNKSCLIQHANKITWLIAEMVARDLHSISIVEGEGFKNLLNFLEPGYKVPSHTHITKVCCDMYVEQKEKLKQEVKSYGHEALTSDIWTSAAVDSY